ncbi:MULTISPECIES: enoyl-CoA hydratase/isomerase family protein [Kribbella]|uniref:Enoyl-CoA hydratase/isomerase family protein n=1 Tax=Kribbella karoonensis TaxID=324851 RepID=A0ABN2CZ26_9ACTN
MSDEVLFEQHGQVAVITLNRPAKLNAVTADMSDALVELARHCNDADDIRAVVLTGTGRAFSAGSDIAELDKYETPWAFRNRADYCDALKVLRKPIVAAVNGFALGGGLETALICDIRLASSTAVFAAAEVKLGWIGGGGMSALLTHTVGPGNAAMMLMTGDPIDARRALTWGLVSEVLEPDALLPRALELATTIASRAPIAVETAKANVAAALNMPLEQAVAYERDVQTICFATNDAAEGRAAFAEKREPKFTRT